MERNKAMNEAKFWKVYCLSDLPDRYLWKNGKMWWASFTLSDGIFSIRKKFSLRTQNLDEARKRRDKIIEAINNSKSPILL